MVSLEQLVPKDHLLRLIGRHISFDFIRERTQALYCADNGRPAFDPVLLIKMLFIGYLFGIRSERQIVREIEVYVAYRWHLGLRLTDKIPDTWTLSQNRHRHFASTDIEQTIFDSIVEQAIGHGRIGGRVFYSDSNHLKASANKNGYDIHQVAQKPVHYLEELNSAIDAYHLAHGKKPLSRQDDDEQPPTKEVKISPVDPDAGYAPHICKGLIERNIYSVIGYRRPNHKDSFFYKREYDTKVDVYRCPNGQLLAYSTTNRLGYREYKSDAKQCSDCPSRAHCTASKNHVKVVTRHVWQHFKEQLNANRLSVSGKEIYKHRKETVERSFADAKQLHGHRYARFRGLAKVKAQALLAAACQNMKKMASLLEKALRLSLSSYLTHTKHL